MEVSVLDAHSEDLAWDDPAQHLQDLRHKRPEIGKPVASRYENHYGNVEPANILLVGKIPVDGEKNVKLSSSQLQEFPVFLAGPAHFGHRARLMPGEIAFQLARQAFIE
ncbi:MAG: hypothetical protein ACRD88_04370 [Terriglobia bacterium]